MKAETIEYKDGAVNLRGHIAYDDQQSGKRPGILVMPEAFGLGPHARERAERLAKLGYVALAGDPYGDGVTAKDLQEAMKHAGPLREDTAKFRARGRAALDKLASLPQVDSGKLAAIGYCMGGTFALELARDGAPLRGIVTFHAGLETKVPAQSNKTRAKVLICTGADDPFVPVAQVNAVQEELTKAGVDWQIISYGGAVHSFTNPDADALGMAGLNIISQ
jgi:dienelactone hydrolase